MPTFPAVVGTITSNLSENETTFGSRINNILLASGPMTIIDVKYRLVPASNDRVHQLTMVGYDVGQVYGAAVIQVSSGQDLDAAFAAWMVAHPTAIPQKMADLSPVDNRLNLSQSMLVLYTFTPNFQCPVVLRNVGADIASAAAGALEILNVFGLAGRGIIGRNMTDSNWIGGGGAMNEGYGVWDYRSGEWLCAKYCC